MRRSRKKVPAGLTPRGKVGWWRKSYLRGTSKKLHQFPKFARNYAPFTRRMIAPKFPRSHRRCEIAARIVVGVSAIDLGRSPRQLQRFIASAEAQVTFHRLSSKNSVPPWGASTRPFLADTAPVYAPRTCPIISLSGRAFGKSALQLNANE